MKKFILLCVLMVLALQVQAEMRYNWYWGIERINQDDYFIINFKPEFHYSIVHLKLNIPVEVNSNWKLYKNHWDNAKEDSITKIEYLTVTNQNYLLKIAELNNMTLGNGELVNRYSDNLFIPLSLKRGLLSSLAYNNFSFRFITDDVIYCNLFFVNFNYTRDRLKTGLVYGLDYPASIHKVNLFFNYDVGTVKGFAVEWQNDIVKDMKQGFIGATGIDIRYKTLFNFCNKIKFYQKDEDDKIFFNKFYSLKSPRSLLQKNSFGISSQIGYNFLNIFNILVSIDKIENVLPASVFQIMTGDKFPSLIFFSWEIYNRCNEKWYDVIRERGKNTFLILKSGVPLSKYLSLKFDYIKSFYSRQNQVHGLHQVLFYTEFMF